MTSRKTTAPSLSVSNCRQLESFFSGYLHEDYVSEYGTPEGALRAWRQDASAKEGQLFDEEAARLLAAAESIPFDQVAAFVRRDLGSAWRPSDLPRLRQLLTPSAKRIRR
jgi:hypothetical protein